ncbi:nucleoside triphosphate pyrophosphohydrolase [Halioxenophilus sp. WMMB6]|uniref:nucleoside triphosphate pyrophosphohydrolase n=1 Tax=Halioxenophilus sp. WMMB6 TaxID=3073815 RepID=UPI00295EAF38|nr:nucleoside triphosphate pyrophosphohydrolase [Halioxenophilus sp. WMMB6]
MYTIADLQAVMARLRDPEGGCPWDLQQSFKTIAPSTIEEAYEVADAIERDDLKHLPEELGDLLFQVIFYSQLGEEQSLFTFEEIVHTIVSKLLRRHPHVFPSGQLNGESTQTTALDQAQVKENWEAIKAEERSSKGLASIVDDVPVGLPALSRAQKLQKRLARAGWDWQAVAELLDKLDEEVAELKAALAEAEQAENSLGADPHVVEELGDVLFMAVNLARFLDIDAENCLRAGNRKFESRVKFIERQLANQGQSFTEASSGALEVLWQQAKSYD